MFKNRYPDRNWIWLAIVVLVLAALACGGETEPTATPLPPPTEVPPTEPPPTAVPEVLVNLEIVNDTDLDLCYLYIVPNDQEDFGDDQLSDDQMIGANSSYTITNIPTGVYKVSIHDCEGNLVNALYGATMDVQEMTWTIRKATLTVANESTFEICEIYVSPNSAPESAWGPDQLGDQTLSPGQTITFTLAEGKWDVRAVPCDAGVEGVTELGIKVEGEMTWTLSDK